MLNYLSCLRVNYVKRLNILGGFPILLKSFLLCSTDKLLTTLYLWLKRGQRLKVSGLKTSSKCPSSPFRRVNFSIVSLTPVAWENSRHLTTFGFPVVAKCRLFSQAITPVFLVKNIRRLRRLCKDPFLLKYLSMLNIGLQLNMAKPRELLLNLNFFSRWFCLIYYKHWGKRFLIDILLKKVLVRRARFLVKLETLISL